MKKSESIKEIAIALANTQKELPTIAHNHFVDFVAKSGMKVKYSYADLTTILETVNPILTKNGLSITQLTGFDGDTFGLETTLMHISGEWISGFYPINMELPAQDMGSALSYSRRYSITLALNLSTDADDDGAAAQQTPPVNKNSGKIVYSPPYKESKPKSVGLDPGQDPNNWMPGF